MPDLPDLPDPTLHRAAQQTEQGAALAPVLAALPDGRFEGREAFHNLVRQALATAAQEGWPQLILCDATFEDWPLRERAVVDSLRAWSKTGRRITLLATRYDAVVRLHPRFVSWRTTWGHIVEARQCKGQDPLAFPSAIWSPHWVLRRLDLERCTGVAGVEPKRRVALRELLDEHLRNSAAGFASTTLGL